jgi:hypothetical protein
VIKAVLSNGSLLIGLSAENIKRLQRDMPIVFDARPFGLKAEIIIVAGETEQAILDELRKIFTDATPP